MAGRGRPKGPGLGPRSKTAELPGSAPSRALLDAMDPGDRHRLVSLLWIERVRAREEWEAQRRASIQLALRVQRLEAALLGAGLDLPCEA